MPHQTRPVPEGFHTVTPYKIVRDASCALDFHARAFGAEDLMRHADPDGKVRHAQIRIDDLPIMVAVESSEFPAGRGPESLGGATTHLFPCLENVDAVFARALAAGATELMPVQDQWYGDRQGGLTDPFGHVWWVSTHMEDLSQGELARRAAARS